MPDAVQNFDDLLQDDGDGFSLVKPEILEAGTTIAETFFNAGVDAWSTSLGRGVLYSEGQLEYQRPADALADETERVVITTIAWSGDREGEMHLVIPELGAKGAVAYFMALALGTDPDPENTELDEEGLDAYGELINTFLGQAAQALRGEIGGELKLTATGTRTADFEASTPAVELGTDEMLVHTSQITIEGMVPVVVRLLISVSCTGISADIDARDTDTENGGNAAGAETAAAQDSNRNIDLAMQLKVPVVVILAEKTERVEQIGTLMPGSIIEFRKYSSELLDICANGVKFGEGEVVITNEHFGIQVKKLVDIRAAVTQSV